MTSALQTKVFISSDQQNGFGVSSTIIYGPTEALLVDSQFSLSNAHRLVAEILELDRDLTQVFISHMHPDHYLGLEVVKGAFPNARVIAYRDAADEIDGAFGFKIDHWRSTVLGRNGATTTVPVERIEDAHLLVDGETIEILGLMRGDSAHAAALWIPTIKTLVAADMVFSDAHVWVADARTPAERQDWLDTLDRLEALGATTIIPGHAPSTRRYDPNGIGFTRRYLHDFIRELKDSTDSADLIARMDALYPALPVRICLEYSAKILKDHYRWDGDWPESLRDRDAVI
ncbi:MBL fold metallo-hydrolase [Xanthomonas citri]|uniref:MBL fold metallo-hydrolase n=1 Tax=Xanthomonas citri TaxID=346 RepID=UPI0001CED44E|nr:MBL fold metallo-hydrolase [Xanthomonas citri]AMU98503.1 metallo-beta-lactamase [Xanthomonas citri pv. aurantifolii]AMV03399.1 metallo-beta-lactamase [Xanthomonas citri pv. aurantifolii]EFF49498.1 metallo-beta-lactamase superfamily protein [Xanthomonas citri pv. aurantifolii str. ICPB 10535]MCC8489398.1 MBL fold metallo-hydrolase [Xanthomonas citri pv. fuscans]TBW93180.1 metallo-beta-lactamase [Xanthomonas citri pv. aurantifolii]